MRKLPSNGSFNDSELRFHDALAGIGLFQPYRPAAGYSSAEEGAYGISENSIAKLLQLLTIAGGEVFFSSITKLGVFQKSESGLQAELGVFQKSESGLQAVASPSEMFLSEQHSDSDVLAWLAVAVVLDGSRAFVIEIQISFSFPVCVLALVALCHICLVAAHLMLRVAGMELKDSVLRSLRN
nr:DNA repair protein RadA/Sms [Ipomoea batatas]